ncbi:MAG: non-ribosomal peptide synthetase [Vulcanimicrobiaceae bacterium]
MLIETVLEGRLVFPCSQAQRRFWFEEQLHPGNPALNVAVRWRLEGDVVQSELEEAWRQILARHLPLRTFFEMRDGQPVQVVDPSVALRIPVIDLTGLPEKEAAAEAERIAQIEARTPFDLSVPPLIRATRLKVRDRATMLLVTAHHTVCDGWSIGLLAREMGEICAARHFGRSANLPELPVRYGDYAIWQREWLSKVPPEDETEALRRFLKDYKQFEVLPDRARPSVQTSNGSIASVLLDRALTDGLVRLAQSSGCTLFMAAWAALLALLYRYTGETDIALGTQVVGRDEVELEDLVGPFINTIALRGDLSGDPTFLELLDRSRDSVTDAFELRHVPLERIVEIVNPKRDLSRNALFSVNFIFQRSFITNESYGAFDLVDLPSRSAGSLYDLNFFMVERPEGWRASCEYNTDLFDNETVLRMLGCLENIFRAVVADPAQKLSTLPILSAAQRDELILAGNRTDADYPKDQTLPLLFAAQAARTPDAVALVCGDRSLSYRELEAASNRLARELTQSALAPQTRIGVLLDRTPELLIALLAIHKAGSAYIPLDPNYPQERLAYVIENSCAAALLTRSSLRARLPKTEAPILELDTEAARIALNGDAALEPVAKPDDVAYIIYTSGSTGKPKGVQIQQRSLVNFLWAMRSMPGLSPADTLVAVTTISFDIAGLELFLPLVTGAKLVVAREAETVDGAALLELLRRSGATVLQATPVTWQLLIEAGWNAEPKLKMLCGGEALPRKLAEQLLQRDGELWNMYGPTETTIWSSALRVTSEEGPVPIGPPIANTQFYVLDRNRELVPAGVPGELYIGGDGVALGYFDLPVMTRERFVSDPFRDVAGARLYRTGDVVRTMNGGNFEFLGRTDHQIKLRGFRIELGEIETALARHPDVAEAVAIVGKDRSGEGAIWAYVVLESAVPEGVDTWAKTVRLRLGQFLPSYMLPSSIVVLPALPRTPNGKIDRKALPAPEVPEERSDAVAATLTPTEARLATIVSALLGRERIGRDEDMFALGLHSLLAIRLVSDIETTFRAKLPLRLLMNNATVGALAQLIDSLVQASAAMDTAAPIVTHNARGSRPPFIYLHSDLFAEGLYCRRLAAVMGSAQPILAVAPHGTAGLPDLPTIEAMAQDYVARIRAVQPEGPYRIGGFCVSGLVAYELARQLSAQGQRVEKLVLVNSSCLPKRAIPLLDWLIRRVGLDARLETGLRDKLIYNIARLEGALIAGPRATFGFVAARVKSLVSHKPEFALDEAPQPFGKQRGTRDTENSYLHLVAALTYHPQPYDGEVTLIWGSQQDKMQVEEPTAGWADVAKSVRVEQMTGGHVAPLNERLEELASVLERVLHD